MTVKVWTTDLETCYRTYSYIYLVEVTYRDEKSFAVNMLCKHSGADDRFGTEASILSMIFFLFFFIQLNIHTLRSL